MPDDKLIPFEVEVNVNKVRVRVTLMLKARPTGCAVLDDVAT
jgi:hypothetical protein